MIILRDSFDPIMIDHLEIIKKYKKLGLYIDDKGLTDKNIRLKLAKKMIKPYHHVKIVNEIKDDDQIITSNFTDSYQKIYEGKLYLLPKKIRYDVLKSDEYLKKIVSNYNHGKRLKHVYSMTNLALDIASIHHVDKEKIKICAMFHDIYKQIDADEARKMMIKYFPQYVNQDFALYHQYLGAWFLKHNLGIYDQKMYDAIMYHTTGESNNKLAMILFIADKLDPSRGYDTSYQMSVVKRNLKKGFELVKKEQIEYITKVEGKQVGTAGNYI